MSESFYKLRGEIQEYARKLSLPKGRMAGKYIVCEGNYDYKWGSLILNKKNIYDRTGSICSFYEIIFDSCLEYSVISKDDFRNLKFKYVDSLINDFDTVTNNTIATYSVGFFNTFKID